MTTKQMTMEPDEVEPPEEAMDPEPEQEKQQETPVAEEIVGWIDLLQADTPKEEVHQRAALSKGGQQVMVNGQPLMLDYVTARFVQDRLDAAVGPTNWQTLFESLPSGAVRCGIGIRDPQDRDAAWVWKWDVGVPSMIEPDKGAHSDAFKRAGVQWGIARDLYDARDEERLAPTDGQQAGNGQAAPSVRQMVEQQPGMTQVSPHIVEYDPEVAHPQQQGQAAWVCPIHNDTKIVPAGVSKRTGRSYNAFYACPVSGCDQKGPSVK